MFGADDCGTPAGERYTRLLAVAGRTGCNAVWVDGDAVLARGYRNSEHFVPARFDRRWEAAALSKWESSASLPPRDGTFVVLKVTAAGRLPFQDGSALTITPADVGDRCAAAVRESAAPDMVILHATAEAASGSDAAATVAQLLHAGSELVAAGKCARFGISMDAWTSGAVVALVDAIHAHPHCIAASFLASLAQQDCLMPRSDLGGKSAAATLHAAGLVNLVRAPLDAVVDGRPFRCVDTPEHRDHHPTRVTALLNDVINFAIHCEVLWERSVRAAVLEDWALAAKTKTDRTGARRVDGVTANVDPQPASWGGLVSDDAAAADEAPLPTGPVPALQDTDVAWARIIAQQLQRRPDMPFTLLEWEYTKQRRMRPAMGRLLHAVRGSEGAREWAAAYKAFLSELTAKLDIFVAQAHSFQAQHAAAQIARIAGKPVAQPPALHAVVASLLLSAIPGSVLVSEVPELFGLRPRSAARAAAAAAAAAASDTLSAAAATEPGDHANQAAEDAAQRVDVAPGDGAGVVWDAIGPRLRAAVVESMAVKPPSWTDPLAGVPSQAELAPLQAAARRMRGQPPAPT